MVSLKSQNKIFKKPTKAKTTKNPAASVSAEFKLADSSLHWEAENDAIIKISWTRQKIYFTWENFH